MAISLDLFITRANAVEADQSLYVSFGTVHDTGKLGTAFTRDTTFQHTTQEFINSLTQEYGEHVGKMASDLLQTHVAECKPLTAGLVKEFVNLGRQHQMEASLQRLATDQGCMESFLREVTGYAELELTPETYQELRGCIRSFQASLLKASKSRSANTLESLVRSMQEENAFPLIKHSFNLIIGNPKSPLTRIGYPHEGDEQVRNDKLRVLQLLQPLEGDGVSMPTLIQAMSALGDLRAVRPAPQAITGADLFGALFPEGTTPGLARPSDEELALYTPRQLSELLDEANRVFTERFGADQLPAGSPLRGSGRSLEQGMAAAKANLLMPRTLASLEGSRITLADLPQLQFEVAGMAAYPSLNAALEQLSADFPHQGALHRTEASVSPTITFHTLAHGAQAVEVGPGKYGKVPSQAQTDDMRAYRAGSYSQTTEEILLRTTNLCQSGEQTSAVIACLTRRGAAPLNHVLGSLGDFAASGETCVHSQELTRKEDGSVEVTLSTSPDVQGLYGAATLTYRIDVNGRVGIADFQWDRPTLAECQASLLRQSGHSQSVSAQVDCLVKERGLGRMAADFLRAKVMSVVAPQVEGASSYGELPSAESLLSQLPLGEASDSRLDAALAVTRNIRSLFYSMSVPAERQDVFMESVTLMSCFGNDIALAELRTHLEELEALRQSGTLDAQHIWQMLFDEPLTDDRWHLSRGRVLDFGTAIENRLTSRLYETLKGDFMAAHPEIPAAEVEMDTEYQTQCNVAILARFNGLTPERAVYVAQGGSLDRLTEDDIHVFNDLAITDRIDSLQQGTTQFKLDFHRIGSSNVADKRGRLPNSQQPPSFTLDLPLPTDGGHEVLTINPRAPEGLEGKALQAYQESGDEAITRPFYQRIIDYCGVGHEAQAVGSLLACSQGGQVFLYTLGQTLDCCPTEHSAALITVTGDGEHNVHVHYDNVEDSPLRFHWDFIIRPDGSQTIENFLMERGDAE